MGYVLLWIECLAVGLAVVTTFLAWLARTKLPRWRLIGGIVVVLLMPVLTCGALLSGVSRRHWGQQFVTSMFNPLVALSAGYLVGATGLVVWGLRRRGAGSSESVAAGWDLRKCVLAVLIGILVFSVTYRRLDQQVCQRLVKIGVEADELASSVAPPLLPEKENAAIIYRRVFDSWKNTYPWPPVWEDALDAMSASSTQEKVEFDFRATELTDFLVERAADLELLRRASALPGCRFDRDFERLSFGAVFPENRKMKTATLLFGVEAHRQAALGNTSKALENVNAMFAIAQHTASEPILLSVLSGAAIEGMAFKTLQTVLLTEKMQEEDSTLELAAGISYQSRISESIRMEKVTGLRTFSELVPWRDPDEAGEQFDNLIPGIPSLYRIFLFDHDIRYYRETIGHFEDLANEPYRKTKQEWMISTTRLKLQMVEFLLLYCYRQCPVAWKPSPVAMQGIAPPKSLGPCIAIKPCMVSFPKG